MTGIVRDRRRMLAALAVVGLATMLVIGAVPVGAQQDDAAGAGNSTSTVPQTGPHDRADLERGGAQVANAPSSVRWYGEHGQLWLRHVGTGLSSRLLDDEEVLQYVGAGDVVGRDYLYLEGVRGRSAPQEDLSLTIVYWQPSTTENGDEIATNQQVDNVDVTLPGGGYDRVQIPLEDHYDEAVHVTMWVDGNEDDLRWTFKQQSSAATQSFAADSRGDFALYGALYYLLIVFGTAGGLAIVSYKPLKRAAAPPGYSPTLYVGAVAFPVFMTALLAWDWLLEIVSTAPWIMSVLIGLAIYLVFVETLLDSSRKALFFQLHVDEAEDHEDGTGTIPFSTRVVRLVDTNHGTGVIKKGIRPFLSRMFGRTPVLDLDGTPRTALESKAGPFSECYLVNPYAEDVLDYQPEEWMLDIIEERDFSDLEDGEQPNLIERTIPDVDWFRVIGSLALLPIGWLVGSEIVASGLIGLTVAGLGALFWCSTPKIGRARTELAPMGFDDVLANVIQSKKGLEEVADRDYYREQWHKELGSNHAKRKNEAEDAESGVYQGVIQKRTQVGRDDRDDIGTSNGVSADDD